MKVSELGEFGLVELIAKTINSYQDNKVKSWQDLIIGIGDDTAVWKGENAIQLATTDSLVENIHFTPDIMNWADLGWKALAINLSDIAAMGGIPRYSMVSLALAPETEVENVISFYEGLFELAKQHEVAVIGGDTDNTPRLSVTVTVFGEAEKSGNLLLRSSAAPGDLVAVTGFLGTASAGYKMLSQKLVFNTGTTELLKKAFRRPQPRLREGRLLLECGIKTAIDISDGLISDMKHICKASNTGALLRLNDIPVAPPVKANFGKESYHNAMSGGEDYELLFTGTAEIIEKVKSLSSCNITIIGEITREHPGEVIVMDNLGQAVNIKTGGWEHFKSSEQG